MEYFAGFEPSAPEALLLMIVIFGLPLAIFAAIVGGLWSVKNRFVKGGSDDIPYNPAYNLKQEQPEVKQFTPYDEPSNSKSPYRPLRIGLAILIGMFALYFMLAFVLYGL